MSKKLLVLLSTLIIYWAWAQEPSTSSTISSTSKKRTSSAAIESTGATSTTFVAKKSRPADPCEILATPDYNIIKRIAHDIDSVGDNEYIGIESPSLTNAIIIETLEKAVQRGAKIKVFVNDPTKESNPELTAIYNDLISKNITVIIIPNLHAKRIVIRKNIGTPRIVYLGSLNMTQNSPHNYEIMMRCTDPKLFIESYGDQQRLGTNNYRTRPTTPVDFTSRRIINSFYPEAIAAKKRMMEEFAACSHPHDYLYFIGYTLDDPEFINAIIQARQQSNKSITVILDDKTRPVVRRQLVLANIDVYIFNKNRTETTPQGHPKLMHIKAIFRQCNQECLTLISTANFTQTGRTEINHDLWEPCSFEFSEEFKALLETLKQKCEKLNPHDYQPQPNDGTPEQMGQRILQLGWCKDSMFDNTDEILRLIQAGADLSTTGNTYGGTALTHAIAADHTEIFNAVIAAGADVNQISIDPENNRHHYTPLQIAARGGRTQFVNQLIEADIRPTLNYTDEHGNTPLFMAISGNHIDIVKALLAAGADPNIPGDYRENRLHSGSIPPIVQTVLYGNIDIAQALIEAHVDINAIDREGLTAFLRAANMGNIPMIQLLARAGADINARYPGTRQTALMQAIGKNNMKLITALLAAGADINAQDKYKKTAFDHAAGKPEILNLLNDVKFARENLVE